MRRWLTSAELEGDAASAVGVVEQSAAVTKDALQVIAASAPGPIGQSELVKGLTDLGYKATDITKQLVIDGLGAVEEVTGGSVVRQVRQGPGQQRGVRDELHHRPSRSSSRSPAVP